MVDRAGTQLQMHPGARAAITEILTDQRWTTAGTEIAYASRTDCPEWAREALGLMRVTQAFTLAEAAAYKEIYPVRSKTEQFSRLREKSGVEYREMLFFDNEMRNVREVGALGCLCVYTPGGMALKNWQDGLEEYAKHARFHIEDELSGRWRAGARGGREARGRAEGGKSRVP